MSLNGFDLSGKVAVLTGSTKGMGLAIATAMAQAGASVVISGRDGAQADKVAAGLRAKGHQVRGIACDVTDENHVRRFAKEALAVFGRIDILVCNAASDPPMGALASITAESFDRSMLAATRNNLVLINLVAPDMAQRRDGAIILTSSIIGSRGTAMLGAYGMSKAAIEAMVRNLAVELGKHNIRTNAIAPGLVRTDFSRSLWQNADIEKQTNARTPLGRIAEAEDVVGAALLLASPAGAFITGQTIHIDGGLSAV